MRRVGFNCSGKGRNKCLSVWLGNKRLADLPGSPSVPTGVHTFKVLVEGEAKKRSFTRTVYEKRKNTISFPIDD